MSSDSKEILNSFIQDIIKVFPVNMKRTYKKVY